MKTFALPRTGKPPLVISGRLLTSATCKSPLHKHRIGIYAVTIKGTRRHRYAVSFSTFSRRPNDLPPRHDAFVVKSLAAVAQTLHRYYPLACCRFQDPIAPEEHQERKDVLARYHLQVDRILSTIGFSLHSPSPNASCDIPPG